MIATVIHTHSASCILADGPWCLAAFMVICAVAMLPYYFVYEKEKNRPLTAEEWAETLTDEQLLEFLNKDWDALDREERRAVSAEHWRRQLLAKRP